jgi:hypothetical protein
MPQGMRFEIQAKSKNCSAPRNNMSGPQLAFSGCDRVVEQSIGRTLPRLKPRQSLMRSMKKFCDRTLVRMNQKPR